MDFEPMFEDFYFSREEPITILEDINNSSKCGVSSSKMNLTIKNGPKSK